MRITLLSLLIMACAAPNMLADPSLSIRRGYLTAIPMQHPMVTDHDDYFDVYEHGEMKRQIIVVFDPASKRPSDRSRALELTGRIERIDLGGPKGTRKSYSNEVLYVTGWKYIEGI